MNPFSVLAFLIPFPLFYDLGSLSFIIHQVQFDEVLILDAGAPIPIGLVALLLIFFFSSRHVFSMRVNKAWPYALSCLAVFTLIAANRVDTFKLIAVLLPVLLLLIFSATLSKRIVAEQLSRGYIAGLLLQAYLHVASILLNAADFANIFASSRNFFGYEIYQALISYSAVMSLAGGAGVIFALSLSLSRLHVLIMTAPIYIIVIFAARKAAIVDLAIIYIIIVLIVLRYLIRPRIGRLSKEILTNLLFLILLSCVLYLFLDLSPREISFNDALDQREGSYDVFWGQLQTLSLLQVLLGYESGWGGYSNFIVELTARSGLIGMVAYLLGLTFAVRRFYGNLFLSAGDKSRMLRGDIYMRGWFTFALGSLIVGNLVNLNIQLPYFSINFLMINICFSYYYSRYFCEKFLSSVRS